LREEHELRVFEDRVLWKIFGPKRDELMREWRRLIKWSCMIFTPHHTLFGASNQDE